MALFYFSSIEPKTHKKSYWFISAALVLLAGFFSLGISFSPDNRTSQSGRYQVKFVKKVSAFEVKKRPLGYKIIVSKKTKPKPSLNSPKTSTKRTYKKTDLKTQKITKSSNTGLSHSSLNELYQKAGSVFGLDWRILAAVHSVESGQAIQHYKVSYAGARGPMQFLPSTFNHYAVDGDGDGQANIYDVDDAVFTAARYIAANGGMDNIRKALFRYNHSWSYVEKILAIASRF